MKTPHLRSILVVLLVGWFGVTLAAFAGMAHLWWTRERVLYVGKTTWEQRVEVLERAGLDPMIVVNAVRLASAWPPGVSYDIRGGGDHPSYIKYLLAPRIPSGGPGHEMLIQNGRVSAMGLRQAGSAGGTAAVETRSPAGFLLSLVLLSALAIGVRRIARQAELSFPEAFALALLFLSVAVGLSRFFLRTAVPGYALTVAAALGIGAYGLAAVARKHPAGEGAARPSGSAGAGLCLLLGCVSVGAVILSFLFSVVVVPDDWDAWAIWGAKAKVLALGEGSLKDVIWFGHEDYPLLWPGLWAFSAWLGGGWEEHWCRGWGALLFGLAVWQCGVVIFRKTGRRLPALAGAALFASIPKAVMVASWSYAEAPLWLMTVCAFGRLWTAVDASQEPFDAVWAGLFAVAGALTKNEGLFFAVVGLFWILLAGGRSRWKKVLLYALPLVLLYLPWVWWTRIGLVLGSHATAGLGVTSASLAHAAQRLGPALGQVMEIWADVRQWSVGLLFLVAGGVYTVVKGDGKTRLALTIPCALLAGLFAVVVFHTADLHWQMGTAWDRLTLQALLPLIVITVSFVSERVDRRTEGVPTPVP